MRRFLPLVCVCFSWALSGMAQSPFTVESSKTLTIPVPGATAAYSLDVTVAEAHASGGVVQVAGTGPGTTSIIVVTPTGTTSLRVTVLSPPARHPAGYSPGMLEGASGETGSYELRYSSYPQQLNNALEFRRQEGDSFKRFQLVNANYFSYSTGTGVGFPLLSYEISSPARDVVFVDQMVTNSPLTVDGPIVRGFHLRDGNWIFHGGFTSVATFQDYFLVTDPEYVAGVTRQFRLSAKSGLAANLYYFQNPVREALIARNGTVGSLVYTYKPNRNFNFLAELGVNRGVGAASRANYDDSKQHFSGSFHYLPSDFASLAVNSQHGVFGDLQYTRTLTERLSGSFAFDESDFQLRAFRQNTLTASSNLVFKLNRNFSLNGGTIVSRFDSQTPSPFNLQTLSAPVGVDFVSRHFSAGALYQPTTDFTGGLASGYAANLGGALRDLHLGAYFRHDVQIPTVQALFSAVPGLQEVLTRSGVFISDPEQLLQFLRDTAFLATLGFANGLQLNLSPSRNDLGFNADWVRQGPHRQRLTFSFLNSRTELLAGGFVFRTGSVTYTRELNRTNEIAASASLYKTIQGPSSSARSAYEVSFRHRFYSAPSMLLPGRHGDINGHVFRDDASAGRYSSREPGLAGVEVELDGVRTARTDADGYYQFRSVPYGVHRVEAKVQSSSPFFFTTDSPATAGINSSVDFGVSFIQGRVFGFVLNDAGEGVPGVVVELVGDSVARQARTAANGKFAITGLPEGKYSIATSPDSFPAGYDLVNLPAQTVEVRASLPEPVTERVRALRSVSGIVRVYDSKTLRAVPAPQVVVTVPELSLAARTDAEGRYVFRNLPAGTYTIKVEHAGRQSTRPIFLPGEPTVISNLDFTVNGQ